MKRVLLVAVVLAGISFSGKAQCDKKTSWTGAKAEFLDASGNVERALDEKIVFQLSASEIRVVHGGQEDDALTGTVTQTSCNWSEKYKNGKAVLTAKLTEANGGSMDGSVTIEAKDGKITITLQLQGPNGTKIIRVPVDSYKEL
ncbi:MAG TPA: hypothetical protein VFV08_05270 [Puia sp.]|nr:hypothetical protein [Puia sp.]